MFFLTIASLCVGFILGWIVARPRRWGAFPGGGPAGAERPESRPEFTGGARPGV
ncbi:hypothetical protein NE236_12895 [Actinoallomurus purpureus]|uniref:hypothetical protein n=1 Tax=Actinoallomurus purpureus TaxID=478114 RepID=UPI002091F923|nr:hypothetical protein [Actinoallomurus purpureus]MCO6005882.1 hypothetical protein [Actinoallomurus purpureus]